MRKMAAKHAAIVSFAIMLPLMGCSMPPEASRGQSGFPRTPAASTSSLVLRPHHQQQPLNAHLAFAHGSAPLLGRNGRRSACANAAPVAMTPLQRAGRLPLPDPSPMLTRGAATAGRRAQAAAGARSPLAMSTAEAPVESKEKEASDFLGFHHIELWVGNALQAATFFVARLGFEPVAYSGLETGSRDVVTHVVRQDKVVFAFCSPLQVDNNVMGRFQEKHGDAVRDVAISVSDCKAVFKRAVEAGAEGVSEPHEVSDEHGSVMMATIRSYGDVLHTFIESKGYDGPFLPNFKAVEEKDPLASITPCPELLFIDHVVGNQPDLTMNEVCDWYTKVLGFKRFWSVDDSQVVTEFSSLRSVVMTDPSENVKMPINEPANGIRKSQIQEYIDYNGGPGVQHIALRTDNILHTVTMLRQRGGKFLKVPQSYYDDLRVRLKGSSVQVNEDLDAIEALNLLCDFDDEGYLLQIFMRPIQDRPTLFLEVIQRRGHEGFGVGNFKALFEAIEREQSARGNL
mmetsp:Transcript_7598/g.14950  ORF Transcript_7598/g.14950 Transcript_7598/m.14950 type:complete len:513 (+) Transcript_7598:29-1567(+)